MTNAEACFHCALPVVDDRYSVELDGVAKPVCCPGCKAVAELIRDAGMSQYYALRDAPEPGVGKPEASIGEWEVFNREDMLEAFASQSARGAETSVFVGGMYCSACSWLIETRLGNRPGVSEAAVNPVTHRLRLAFDPDRVGFGDLLAELARLGYHPQPLAPEAAQSPEVEEQRTAIKRLLVASLGMMQVMMFAVALYAGGFSGISPDMQRFLRLVSFFVATPVVFYSARPFFTAALRGIRTRRPGMDLPVSIAIGAAYVASVWSTFNDGAEVWFDSVTMFVFFLTLGRYLEMRARHRSIDKSAALSTILPNTVIRVDGDDETTVAASSLTRGDVVRIRAGEPIPADGTLIDGETTVDEALLSGESRPASRAAGDTLFAGAVNLDRQILMRVDVTGVDTTLGTISRLSERARFARPRVVSLADRVASYLVVAILAIATITAASWSWFEPERAFEVTLSVLVVTCPCALALATPAAFAAAGSRLAELRLLITNGDAIENLARATHVAFDKTGTLTVGRPEIIATELLSDAMSQADCEHIAAALEATSTHPLARAFSHIDMPTEAREVTTHLGEGIEGLVNGVRYRLGKSEFAGSGDALYGSATGVWLSGPSGPLCVFHVDDQPRPDAQQTITTLEDRGLAVSLVSGDGRSAVSRVAVELGIDDIHAACTPADKLEVLERLQSRGETVIMVGDGINDAPVLAGANASIAPAHSALLAQTSADVIMLGEQLAPVITAIDVARKTLGIVRQNLAWAILYNLTALPLAIAGLVPPWLAAIGMSASSLIVVLNALRLGRAGQEALSR